MKNDQAYINGIGRFDVESAGTDAVWSQSKFLIFLKIWVKNRNFEPNNRNFDQKLKFWSRI